MRQALAQAIVAAAAAEEALTDARDTLRRAQTKLIEERESVASFESQLEAEQAIAVSALVSSFVDNEDPRTSRRREVSEPDRGLCSLLERACVDLEGQCREAELAVHSAVAARNAAAQRVIAAEARRSVDDAAEHLALMIESYREVEPLMHQWLPSSPGLPGSPVPLDAPTVQALRLLQPLVAMMPSPQQVPSIEAAEIRAANGRWRDYFARLCGDAEALL